MNRLKRQLLDIQGRLPRCGGLVAIERVTRRRPESAPQSSCPVATHADITSRVDIPRRRPQSLATRFLLCQNGRSGQNETAA